MSIKLGDILYSSWGWEQTNITFYKVVKRTPKQVQLQQIGTSHIEDQSMAMQGTAVPNEEVKRNGVFRRKVQKSSYDNEEYVLVESYEVARPWDGKPKRYTAYA